MMITNQTNQDEEDSGHANYLIELIETQLKGDHSLENVLMKLKELNLLNYDASRHLILCHEVKQEMQKGFSKSKAIFNVSTRYGIGDSQMWKAVGRYGSKVL